MYPDATNPVNYKRSTWASDPYSMGSLPFQKVGSSSEDYKAYQEAESTGNKIYFAGDGTTEDYGASVQSAYLTGVKVAQQIAGVYIDDSLGVMLLSVKITALIVFVSTFAL